MSFRVCLLLSFALLSMSGTCEPRGTFLVGRQNGTDFLFLFEFKPEENQVLGSAIAPSSTGPKAGSMELRKESDDSYSFAMQDGVRWRVVDSGNAGLVLTAPGADDEIYRGYQAGDSPDWLAGEWAATSNGDTMRLSPEKVTIASGEHVSEYSLHHLKDGGTVHSFILVPRSGNGGTLFYCMREGDNALLLWKNSGDYRRLYRVE